MCFILPNSTIIGFIFFSAHVLFDDTGCSSDYIASNGTIIGE